MTTKQMLKNLEQAKKRLDEAKAAWYDDHNKFQTYLDCLEYFTKREFEYEKRIRTTS